MRSFTRTAVSCRPMTGNRPAFKEIREAIQAGKPVRVILRNYRKDGSLFWNELSITPVYNDEDNLIYYIGIQKDVSEIVALRAEKWSNCESVSHSWKTRVN